MCVCVLLMEMIHIKGSCAVFICSTINGSISVGSFLNAQCYLWYCFKGTRRYSVASSGVNFLGTTRCFRGVSRYTGGQIPSSDTPVETL